MSNKVENSEPAKPVFGLCKGGKQFWVTIDRESAKDSKWINKLRGAHSQAYKAYIFNIPHIREVEKHLGLPDGASGLRDPGFYAPIVFEDEIYNPKGITEAYIAEMKEKGFVYNKKTNTFTGSNKSQEAVKAHLVN